MKRIPNAAAVSVLVVLTAIFPSSVFAQEQDDRAAAPRAESVAEPGVDEVRWKDEWGDIRWWEYPAGVGLVSFGFIARFGLDDPDPNWEGTFGLEQDIVDAIAVREDPWRENLRIISDLSFYGSMAYRTVDSIAVPGVLHDNWEVAWNLAWIDLQAFGLVGTVLWGTQLYVGRVRPAANNCDDPTRIGNMCGPDNSEAPRSFIAGHPATAITAAGLTCLHHQHIPLYGGGAADDIACGVMIGNAVVNGATRLMTEHHYPTDLLFGVVLGLTAGWVLPNTLHYGWGADEDDAAETARLPDGEGDPKGAIFQFAPTVTEDGPAMLLLGKF